MARSRSRRPPNTNRGSRRRRAGDYLVSYGKPPMATRFRPGQSGNPKGRPKRRRNLRTIFEEELNQQITIGEGERSRRLTKQEALVVTVVNSALKREWKALTSVFTMMRDLGMTQEPPPVPHQEPITDQDAALLADYLARHVAQGPGASNDIEELERSGDPEPKGSQDHRDPDQPPPAPRRGR